MAAVIMSRTIRGRLCFVAGPIAFLSFADAVAALAALQADLAGGKCMSAPLIALAKAQAIGLREAASACNRSQAPLQARLLAAADSLHGVAQLAAYANQQIDAACATLTACVFSLKASSLSAGELTAKTEVQP